jgi:hypothetical protein
MGDVTAKLLQQFVGNLEAGVLAPAGKGTAGGVASAGDGAGAGAGGATGAGEAGDAAAAGAGGAANPGAAGSQPHHHTSGEPVRLVGIVLGSAARRTGQFFARLLRRLTGRRRD